MGLETQAPLRAFEAVLDSSGRVLSDVWSVHGRESETTEVQLLELFRFPSVLWVDEFELVAGIEFQRCANLGADADPVKPGRGGLCAVRFHGNVEAPGVKGLHEVDIELKQGFATSADDHSMLPAGLGPRIVDGFGQRGSVAEAPASRTVRADEIGVTEGTDGASAVFLATCPEIATGESAKNGGSAGVKPLALEGVEDLLDVVGHVKPLDRSVGQSGRPR